MTVYLCHDINNLADALASIRSIRSDLALLTSVDVSSKVFDEINNLESVLRRLLRSVPLPPASAVPHLDGNCAN